MNRKLACFAAASLLALCAAPARANDAPAPYPMPTFGGWGFNPADIDAGVNPASAMSPNKMTTVKS